MGLQRWMVVGIALALWLGHTSRAQAQLSMDVEIDETLSSSQSINIQSLLANNGRGPRLFRMYLRNNASEYINDLYFRIFVESDKIGRIVSIHQVSGQPFSLSPGQQVVATNNNIGDGLPGVEEVIQFDGEFSAAGKEFVNKLKGSTSLPADQYRITVEIHRGSAMGPELVSQTAEIGRNIVENTNDFYLLSPGDETGAGASISNPYPNFQWQGTSGANYRLVVVEEKGDESPQSLIDGAMSTSPIQVSSNTSGSLLDYEMLDVVVNQSGFQYPNSGVQNLEPGKTYYWQIFNQLKSSNDSQGQESEIWEFTLTDTRRTAVSQQQKNVSQALQKVLGERLDEFVQDGYQFQSIVIDGQTYQGGQAMQKLMQLGRQAEQGDISIVIEEQ